MVLLTLVRIVRIPDKWETIVVGRCTPPMYLGDFIYFFTTDVMLLLYAIYAFVHIRSTVALILSWLGLGVCVNEFVAPYGYSWVQAVFSVIALCHAIIFFVKKYLPADVTIRKDDI